MHEAHDDYTRHALDASRETPHIERTPEELPMFTVFGATGNTGSVVVERLRAAGKQVRAVVRANSAKVAATETHVGDLGDAAFIARALDGAEGAYLLVPPSLQSDDVLAHNRALVDRYAAALAAARTPHAVLLSSVASQHASDTGPIASTHYAEQVLANAATKLTFVRAAGFMENLLSNAAPMKAHGVLPVFGGGEAYPFTMVATRDIGEVAAAALLDPPAETRWIELRGPRDYSYVDAARIASEILGRTVTATPLPIEQMVPTLMQHGISRNAAELLREMTAAAKRGHIAFEGKGRQVTGTVELAEVLRRGLAG
jgi:uncharacterized protein YbjT (DUF2867 family)